jgi:hypothetical protein
MIGLKTYLSTLSPLLGQSEEMLYERQRALVRQGLLDSVGGRGPGSGVRADESALSPFLISLLAHDILAHSHAAELFCGMKNDAGKCPITGAKTFREGLEAVLGHEGLAEKTTGVMLHRNHPGRGYLHFVGRNNRFITSAFGHKGRALIPVSALRTSTSFGSDFITQVAKDIARFKTDGGVMKGHTQQREAAFGKRYQAALDAPPDQDLFEELREEERRYDMWDDMRDDNE